MSEDGLSHRIIGYALEVHRHFGPGLLESVYERALVYELKEAGFDVKTQWYIPCKYKKMSIDTAFRADVIVNDLVLVENKSVSALEPVYFSKTLTYLRLAGLKLALLIN